LSRAERGCQIDAKARKDEGKPNFAPDLVELLVQETAGYPYFVQYFADVAFSTFEHSPVTRADGENILPEVYAQLDEAFFSGRLYPLTLKERAVTLATAKIPAPFTPTQVVDAVKSFGSDANMGTVQQYLLALQAKNIIYKVRRLPAPDQGLSLLIELIFKIRASRSARNFGEIVFQREVRRTSSTFSCCFYRRVAAHRQCANLRQMSKPK
jgi:hypothetical protein